MGNLHHFYINVAAERDGAWVRFEEFGGVRIHTRGLTDAYDDEQARRMKAAALALPPPDTGDVSAIPTSTRKAINRECLIKHALIDVAGLFDAEGNEVSFEECLKLLRDENYWPLVQLCFRAATQVGLQRAAQLEAAAKN